MSENCQWFHKQLDPLTLFTYPFDLENLPKNGIYFFYEKGEESVHENTTDYDSNSIPLRIVRIGTHKEGNFRSRISEHFLLNESKMNFTVIYRKV